MCNNNNNNNNAGLPTAPLARGPSKPLNSQQTLPQGVWPTGQQPPPTLTPPVGPWGCKGWGWRVAVGLAGQHSAYARTCTKHTQARACTRTHARMQTCAHVPKAGHSQHVRVTASHCSVLAVQQVLPQVNSLLLQQRLLFWLQNYLKVGEGVECVWLL